MLSRATIALRLEGRDFDLVKPFLIFSLDWFAFAIDLSIGRHDTVRLRLSLNDLELHTSHASSYQEGIVLNIFISQTLDCTADLFLTCLNGGRFVHISFPFALHSH